FLTTPLWRMASPAMMLLGLILFPLPWIQVRCTQPIGERGTKLLAVQSGLQAAYGGYSENPTLATPELERQRKSARENFQQMDNLPRSGWMILFPFLLLAAVLAGLVVWGSPLRSALLIGLSAAAGFVLLIQASAGFPLERTLRSVSSSNVSLGD